MGSGRGNNRERELERRADTATQTATQPSEFERYWSERNMRLLRGLDSGADVRNITELSPYLNLYDAAARDTVPEAGAGLLGNNLLSGSNGRIAALAGEQERSRRQERASGELYNSVQGARGAAEQGGMWGAQMDNNRRQAAADRANERYTAYLNRPKQPSFWERLLMGGMQAGAAYVGAGGAI